MAPIGRWIGSLLQASYVLLLKLDFSTSFYSLRMGASCLSGSLDVCQESGILNGILKHSLMTFGELKALITEGGRRQKALSSKIEKRVAMYSPQEVTHLVTGKEEIIPFQPLLHDSNDLSPPRGWSTGKSQ